jgi:hypothetical protein
VPLEHMQNTNCLFLVRVTHPYKRYTALQTYTKLLLSLAMAAYASAYHAARLRIILLCL